MRGLGALGGESGDGTNYPEYVQRYRTCSPQTSLGILRDPPLHAAHCDVDVPPKCPAFRMLACYEDRRRQWSKSLTSCKNTNQGVYGTKQSDEQNQKMYSIRIPAVYIIHFSTCDQQKQDMSTSMSEPEIQATVADILGSSKVLRLLLRRHRAPDAVSLLVPPDIVQLRSRIQHAQVHEADGDEDTVASSVPRRVVLAIDVGGDDGAELYEHVVQRRVDRAASYSTRVPRAPANLDWVGVWIREQGRS